MKNQLQQSEIPLLKNRREIDGLCYIQKTLNNHLTGAPCNHHLTVLQAVLSVVPNQYKES